MNLLSVEGLRARYGSAEVLHGVDFAVPAGEVTVVLGANGAGKTTILRSICAMVRTTGRIVFDGRDISGQRTDRIARPAAGLSGGEQQMLAIARALVAEPRLLLLDEPSLGLAPRITQEVFRALARINEDTGTTILVVEQNAHLALDIGSSAVLVDAGRVVDRRPAESLARDESVRRAYLGY